jgi:CheY-like chemotaxis protein
VRDLTCRILESLGYAVLRAAGAGDGLRVAREHGGPPIRLVVTDVALPGMSRPDLNLIFTSTSEYDDDAGRETAAAGIALLSKPFTPAQLAHNVRVMLDR